MTYQPPGDGPITHQVTSSITAGRDPNKADIVLTPADNSISGSAVKIELGESGATITNTSSFAQLDILHQQGTRFLFPNEQLTITSSVSISIPGSVYTHTINIEIDGAQISSPSPESTTPLITGNFQVPEERRPALIALCAPRFYPDRFGSALLTATDIGKLISTDNETITAKAVNNKLQRLRNEIAHRLHTFLDSREDLADWAIRNGHVTRDDVDTLLQG